MQQRPGQQRQAQQRQMRNRDDQRNDQQDRQAASQGQRAQASGRLQSWQRKNIDGQPDDHTLVKLTMQNGRSLVVDLGPNVDLQRLDLSKNDRLVVQGLRGKINGKDVLMAQRIRAGDKTIRMSNWDPRDKFLRNGERTSQANGRDRAMR